MTEKYTTQEPNRNLLSKEQLAKNIQRHVRSIDNLRAHGLPYIRIPGLGIRFHWPTVEKWLLSHQRGQVL